MVVPPRWRLKVCVLDPNSWWYLEVGPLEDRFGCDHEDDTNPHDALVSFIGRGQRLELPPHVHVKTGRSLQARKGPPQKWTRQHLDLGRLGFQSPEIQTSVCKSSSLWDFVIYRGLSEDTLTWRWRSIKKQLGHGNVSPSRYAVSLVYWTSRHFIDVLLLTGRSKVSSLGRGHWVKEIWVWNIETCSLLWCQRI